MLRAGQHDEAPVRLLSECLPRTLPDGPSFGAALRWSGDTFDSTSNNIRLASYTLVDLRAELPVTAGVRLFVRGENIFDEKYETAYRYGTLGRSIYAGFRGRF